MAGAGYRSSRSGDSAETRNPLAGGMFVGRERQLGELDLALSEAVDGHGRFCLLVGEPGVGKSRLAELACVEAEARGCGVLWGRCWEGGGAPIYWPWVQVIRTYLREPEARDVLARLGPGAGYIAQVVPEVGRLGLEIEPRPTGDSQQARFALFDSVAALFGQATERRPFTVVFDDLHAADPSSLHMLEFVARELRAMPLLLIGTFRDAGALPQAAVAQLLGRLAQEGVTIPLRGLSAGEVATFVEGAAGPGLPDSVIATLHERTGGNPFFLGELVRLLVAEGALEAGVAGRSAGGLQLPEGVRHTVAQRVGLLSEACRDLLGAASVVGREFTRAVLQRTSELPERDVHELLSEAVASGLIEVLSASAGRYAFSHALVAETLHEQLDLARRKTLHARVVGALEELYGPNQDFYLDELAHHALAAGEDLTDGGIDYAVRAGEHAAARFAYEEAISFYKRALHVLERSDPGDLSRRCALLLGLGQVQMKCGQTQSARETLVHAAGLARDLGAHVQLCRAALTLAAPYAEAGFGDELRAILLEEALQALPDEGDALRARVLARLAPELYWTHELERADQVSSEALSIARQIDDEEAIGEALDCRHYAILGPDTLDERLELADELVDLADRTDDPPLELRGRMWRIQDLLEVGDVSAAAVEIGRYGHLARALRQPGHLWVAGYLSATQALIEGRLEVAERLATEAFAIGQRAQIVDAAAIYYGPQLYPICRQRGGAQALLEPTVTMRELYHELVPGYAGVLGAVLWMLGRREEARREYDHLAANDFELPRNHGWLGFQWIHVDLCTAFEDRGGARVLYELLRPYADRYVTGGFGASFVGSVAYPLARLAALTGSFDEAQGHFEAALAAHAATPGWLAETQSEYAAMLLVRGGLGDRGRAAQLLDAASSAASDLGWTKVEQRCRELAAATPAELAERHRAPVAPPPEAVFRLEGEYWAIGFRGRLFRMRDSKGLRLIAMLLARPGAEHPALELVSVVEGHRERSDPGDAGPALDPQAKAAYRERLVALEEEIEEARAFNDPERQANARAEMDFITAELARAVGLGGRDRRTATAAERARVNATNLIRRAIERIEHEDPALGHHLRSTIKTGRLCSYQPGPEPPVGWRI